MTTLAAEPQPATLQPQQPQAAADIATPYLWLDARRVEANVRRLADYANEHGLAIRPHTKTHKSRAMARLQLDYGAIGLTVAKVGEARVMAEAAEPPIDLLLAYPAVDPARAKVVADLAGIHTLRVAVDSTRAADALAQAAQHTGHTIGILIDIDVGMGRTGVATPGLAQQLAQHVDRTEHLRLDGLFCYPGHINRQPEPQQVLFEPIIEQLQQALERFDQDGLCRRIVSGGSTPTAYQSHLIPQLTEIRPGTYIYNDMNVVRNGHCNLDACAARIVATVVSDAVPGQVVVDAGSKTLTSDRNASDPNDGHGYVEGYPEAVVGKLSEEHGQIDISGCDTAPEVGQRVAIVPNHICPCVNLQETAWWDDHSGRLEPMPIDARGKLS